MSNTMVTILVWSAVAAHVAVLVLWRRSTWNLLPLINLAMAALVLGYWVPRWISYARRGVTWYASDQLVPAYALFVCTLSILTLSKRVTATKLSWTVFGADFIILSAAALFFTFYRTRRLF